VGGPNGAGKTTIARAVLPTILGVTDFVNADAIATGLSGVRPELAALAKVRRGRKGLVPRPF
jgi:predicted ABC-type ATPase